MPWFEGSELESFERIVEGAERYRDMLIESDVFVFSLVPCGIETCHAQRKIAD